MPVLSHKTVLLTGALGSLGRAQADTLARAGASLLLLDRPEMAQGIEFAARIGREAGVAARYIGQDLNDLATSQACVRKLAAEGGGIDILINNAALIINKPFEEFSL